MLPPPSSSLGRSHSIIILLMVDRGTDNWCQPPFALRVLAPDGAYVFTLVSVYVFTLVSVYVGSAAFLFLWEGRTDRSAPGPISSSTLRRVSSASL